MTHSTPTQRLLAWCAAAAWLATAATGAAAGPPIPAEHLAVRSLAGATIPFAEFRTNLGALKPGSANDFDFELKQARGWTATGATCGDPRIRIEFVTQKPVDSEGHSLVGLRAIVSPEARGLILAPVTLAATSPNGRSVTSAFWLYADAR